MKHQKKIVLIVFIFIGVGLVFFSRYMSGNIAGSPATAITPFVEQKPSEVTPMAIAALRQREYAGGDFVIEKTVSEGSDYQQFIASYRADGFKIYGLLTIPTAPKPANGFPAIIFVHGYIPPAQYSTTKNYANYQAVLARNGFVTFKPDLRGHGASEGEPVSAHFSEKYVIDTLEAVAYLKKHSAVDPTRIGYWGHSNGGETGLRALVISKDIKAASLWAGVVGSFPDMLETYNAKIPFLKNTTHPLVVNNGLPSTNLEFWNTIDPYTYLKDITARIELQHATGDASVPVELSRRLKEELIKEGKSVVYHEYRGDNHNISGNFGVAWKRTVEFFKKNL